MPCTATRISGSSSLNGTAWGIVVPKHMPTFVATPLSEYFFVLDVLEFYPPISHVLVQNLQSELRSELIFIAISSAQRGSS